MRPAPKVAARAEVPTPTPAKKYQPCTQKTRPKPRDRRTAIKYPETARSDGAQGRLVLRLTIGADGFVTGVDGITSHIDAVYAGNKTIDLKTFTRVTEFDGFAPVSPEFKLPVFNRRDVVTSARLKNGETLVVGGIVDQQSQHFEETGPLGIIRKRGTEVFTRELIITITAILLRPDGTRIASL